MITSKGKTYNTITEAAVELGVSSKTIREWVAQGIIEPPPEFEYGLRTVWHFPPEYLRKMKERIRVHRERRNSAKRHNGRARQEKYE